jgi:hypothetical protein
MWEQLTISLDFGKMEVTTTDKEQNATIHYTSH